MWKYVTRRIKDTVERTYNVLDVRISWPCGNEANNEDSAAGQRKNKPHRCNYALWYKAKAAHSEQSSSSRSEQKHNGNTQGLFQRPIFDAFILANVVVAAWFTSRKECIYNREWHGFDAQSQCKYSRALSHATHKMHSKIFNQYVHTTSLDDIPAWKPVRVEPTDDLLKNNCFNVHAVPISFDHTKDTATAKNAESVGKKSVSVQATAITVSDATEHLIRTLGSIEFTLGVENVAAKRMKDAVSHFRSAAGHGHPGATFNLGICYENGLGVEKSMHEAMKYYRAASAMGHKKAMFNLGVFYAEGRGGLKKNRTAALECFVAAGTSDSKNSMLKKEPSFSKKKSNSISDEGYKSDPGQYGQYNRKETSLSSLETEHAASIFVT